MKFICSECGAEMFQDKWKPSASDAIEFDMLYCEECDHSCYKIDYDWE